MKELGIYIHIPFCKRKCKYCDFSSYSNKDNLTYMYIERLIQEVQENVDIAKEYNVSTIYIGGGTPSYIESRYIKEILENINNKYNIDKNTEVTIEVNPGTISEKKLQDYMEAGINRISIGLQTSNNNLLKTIGRIHTYEEFLEAYNKARNIGFKNINVDLMIGLPCQNLEDVKNDLEKIIKLNPEHISTYSLIVEEGTAIEREIENGVLHLPKEDLERKEYWVLKKMLEDNGYKHYEISNFSKPNYESKHNLNCWEQKEYIGMGIAAHSYINKVRYSNTETFEEYMKTNKHIIHEKQDKIMQENEYMLLGLRKIDGVKISQFKNKFVENPIFLFKDKLNKLVKDGLIEIDIDAIKLTNKGIDLANLVWEEFI